MKLCVFGAGAIGGLIAGRLAQAGEDVSIVARGAHLEAIERDGLTVRSVDGDWNGRIAAARDAAQLGVQDTVIVAVKTCRLAAALPALAPLVGPHTTIVPAMNGVPWWFFSDFGGKLAGMRLEGVDPGGRIEAALPVRQILACVVYPSAYLAGPGVVQHTGRRDLRLGEPSGQVSTRLQDLAGRLNRAGFACRATDDIRREIWLKAIGNAAFNPVSALTRAPLDRMLADPDIYALLETLMAETIAVGRALGLETGETPQARLERQRGMGPIRFSMLQDLEQGRPMEFESLTGAVTAIGMRLGVPTPAMRMVHGLIRTRALAP